MAEGTVAAPAYVPQLASALQAGLPGAQIQHEMVWHDCYRFIVVWDRFDNMDHPERQELVWDIADRALPKNELRKVSMILTLGMDDLPEE